MNSTLSEEIRESIMKDLLGMEVTTRCNSSCGRCFARAGKDGAQELSIGTAAAIASEGRELGYRNLHLTGGEPLLWAPLFDLIGQAAALGYESVFINTNGTLLTRDAAERLAAFGGRVTLSISLQGPEELHDRVRGGGSYRAAITGLGRALDAGLGLSIFTATGKSLVPALPRFAEFLFTTYPALQELTLIQLIRVRGGAPGLSDDLLSPEDFAAMVRMAALLNLYGRRVSVLNNPLAVAASRAMGMPWLPPAPPLHRSGGIMVMADRSVCLAHSTRESFGSYGPGMLGAIMGSAQYRAAVGPDDRACAGCGFMALCREHGMLRPSEWFRSADGSGVFCKEVLALAGNGAVSK
jgi:MoaA/NifB/PqqE/SkfB family radical SAM enzyme